MTSLLTTETLTMTIKEKAPLRFRHEWKHLISPQDDLLISQRLRKLFPHDPHAGSHGFYRVSSLYFDTPYDKALREKVDGVNRREKFRLRHYNDDLSFIRLERKMKSSGLCAKQSARLSLEETRRLLEGDYDFLLQREEPLLIDFYSKLKGQMLRPRTLVVYDREPFLYAPGNVRITLDRNLRTGLASTDFLSPPPFPAPVSDGLTVLEVKYDNFLPEIVQMAVQTPDRRAGAYSKYAVCRRYD